MTKYEEAYRLCDKLADALGIPFGPYAYTRSGKQTFGPHAYEGSKPIAGAWTLSIYKPGNVKLYRLEQLTETGGAIPALLPATGGHLPIKEFLANVQGALKGVELARAKQKD